MDTTILTVLVINLAAITQIISPETVQILMPFCGAATIMGGAIMLNPEVETRKITIGRAFFGLLCGIGGPWALIALLDYWNMPGLSTLMQKPAVLLFEGASMAFIMFWVSKPLCKESYNKAGAFTRAEFRRLEKERGVTDEDRNEG